ncbi:inositol monophosphatase [Paenibacillus selenitireducens]|uniref:Inositol monophosphatase n=1 Tax=Paenibacillus selenitireducens TaxID=1324314 RepID=A0A1T2XNH0_9BACL|nr:inositol monophosphatase [Paenibacillus selenitireducens]OPA81286.1 inositol monophosphatase [Paenibacillus selenitireducens]
MLDVEKLTTARLIASEAARDAGRIAKDRFGSSLIVNEKGEDGDLVTEVDHLAEQVILERIQSQFPDDQIRSEETGWIGVEGEWLWLVDPLDGTNNYAIGLAVFGVSITLLFREQPVLGVIYDSIQDQLYVAEQGKGATCNGRPIQVNAKQDTLRKMTVGWIQGHQVQKDPLAKHLKQHMDESFKRVLRLWAPTLLWAMLARGDLDGIILYNSEGDDLYSGIVLVQEAGGVVMNFDGTPFEGMTREPYIIACHPDVKVTFLQYVRETLESYHDQAD